MASRLPSTTSKSTCKMPHLKGTKPSIQNSQLLISTGIPSLDYIIGGGLPLGSILLIEEDTYGNYSESILKYFMAEGVTTSQALFLASQNQDPSEFLSKLPAVTTETNESKITPMADTNDKMEIAWRYQNMKLINISPTGSNSIGHYYDLTKQMDIDDIKQIDKTLWNGEEIKWQADTFNNNAYVDLLKTIQETIKNGNYSLSSIAKVKNVLRIAIHSLGSRLWVCDNEKDSHDDLLKFFYFLRAILKNSFAVAVITFPAHFYDNSDCLVERLEHSSDYVIELESFAGSSKETNPIFKDYHGLLHIKKIATLNALKPHKPHSLDLAFKMRRKKFIIEVLHLPPELGDSSQREQDDLINSSLGNCSSLSNKKNPVDF